VRHRVVRGAVSLVLLLLLPLGAGCLGGAAPLSPGKGAGEALTEGVTTDPGWPALEEATIRPGTLVRALQRDCLSNFVFTRPDNTSVFLGVTSYCVEGMLVGEYVVLDPGRTDAPAMLVYNSMATMVERGESDPHMLEYNDFAVVRVEPAFRHLVHPAMLGLGGPAGPADAAGVAMGDTLLTYAPPADILPDVPALAVRQSVVTGRAGDWALLTYGAPPGIPGRLGTGVLTPEGAAIGIVVTLGVVPDPGANAVARLDTLMAYAREHANLQMDLSTWAFEPVASPLVLPG
jgi:hypothetical protein